MEEVKIDLFSFCSLRYSSVSIVTRLRVGQPRNVGSMPGRVKVLLFSSPKRPDRLLGPICHNWELGKGSSDLNRLEREGSHSPRSVEANFAWSYTPVPPFSHRAWC